MIENDNNEIRSLNITSDFYFDENHRIHNSVCIKSPYDITVQDYVNLIVSIARTMFGQMEVNKVIPEYGDNWNKVMQECLSQFIMNFVPGVSEHAYKLGEEILKIARNLEKLEMEVK